MNNLKKTKKLTLVLATKNDMYNSKYTTPLFRLKNSLEQTLQNAGSSNVEVIVVDYGSDVKVEDVLKIDDDRIKFIYVDKNEYAKYDTPFNEVKCINRGAKNASGNFIGRIDQDTIVGKRFFEWFFTSLDISDDEFYFSLRRELPPKIYNIKLLKNENDAMFSENCHVTKLSNHFPCHRQFWRYAVGILLIPKVAWHNSRGYREDNTKHNNMEHEFIARLKNKYNLVNLGKKLNYPFYHIQHEVDDSKNREQNPYQRPRDLAKLPFCINNEDWG